MRISKNIKKLISIAICLITLFAVIPYTVSADSMFSVDFVNDFHKHMYRYSDTLNLPYYIYTPSDYDPQKKYPVVIVLQGSSDNEVQNRETMQMIVKSFFYKGGNQEGLQSIVIAAQSPYGMGWGWGGGNETESSKALISLLDVINEEYSTDRDRFYVLGASMGAYGVWDMLIRHNKIFAAGVAICGGGDTSKAAVLKDTPIYVFHGAKDTLVPPQQSRSMVNAIKAAGGTKVNYVEFRDGNHIIWDTAMLHKGLLDWLYSQRLSDRYPEMFFGMKKSETTNLLDALTRETGEDFSDANGYYEDINEIVYPKITFPGRSLPYIKPEYNNGKWQVYAAYYNNEAEDIRVVKMVSDGNGGAEKEEEFALQTGDISMDGKVSSLDVILLERYLAGWYNDAEYEYGKAIYDFSKIMDIDGDGNVNAKDDIILARYLAGWDVKIGK